MREWRGGCCGSLAVWSMRPSAGRDRSELLVCRSKLGVNYCRCYLARFLVPCGPNMLSTHYNEIDSDNISIGSSGALKSGISPWLPRKQAQRLFWGTLLNSFWFTAPTSHAASAGIASFAVEYVQPGRHHADMVQLRRSSVPCIVARCPLRRTRGVASTCFAFRTPIPLPLRGKGWYGGPDHQI